MPASAAVKPIISQLKLPEGAEPYLEGCRCNACGVTYVEPRENCSRCFARGQMASVKLSNTGKIYNWTIVYRNFPGVPVPFVSVIVDLDGGGSIRGNLVDIEPDPANIRFDMPIKTVFRTVEQTDEQGNSYIGFAFVPAN